jgi:hypothetical protein
MSLTSMKQKLSTELTGKRIWTTHQSKMQSDKH